MITRINKELTAAIKAQDTVARSTLRMLKTAMTNESKRLKTTEDKLSEGDCITVVKRTLTAYKDELANVIRFRPENTAQIEELKTSVVILDSYLPQQLTSRELEEYVSQVFLVQLANNKPTTTNAMMGALSKVLKGKADMKEVKVAVESLIHDGHTADIINNLPRCY